MKECRKGSYYVRSWYVDITLKCGEVIELECVEEEDDKCMKILMKMDNEDYVDNDHNEDNENNEDNKN